jgi:hypothetical protein
MKWKLSICLILLPLIATSGQVHLSHKPDIPAYIKIIADHKIDSIVQAAASQIDSIAALRIHRQHIHLHK